jgi:hypothetical protein
METSAKTGQNVSELFMKIGKEIFDLSAFLTQNFSKTTSHCNSPERN